MQALGTEKRRCFSRWTKQKCSTLQIKNIIDIGGPLENQRRQTSSANWKRLKFRTEEETNSREQTFVASSSTPLVGEWLYRGNEEERWGKSRGKKAFLSTSLMNFSPFVQRVRWMKGLSASLSHSLSITCCWLVSLVLTEIVVTILVIYHRQWNICAWKERCVPSIIAQKIATMMKSSLSSRRVNVYSSRCIGIPILIYHIN